MQRQKLRHRDRIALTLNHQEPDRCPLQISFTPEFAVRLRTELELTGKNHNPHGGGNSYLLEQATNQDMLLTSVGWANSYYQSQSEYTDEWGIAWRPVRYETPFGTGIYTEVCSHPLANRDSVSSYKAPDPSRPDLYLETRRTIHDYKAEYWIVGVTVTTILETAWALRGLDQLLMDLALDPEIANAILDIPFYYHLGAAKELARLGVDMIWMGDDVGTQRGMFISPTMWREYLKPKMALFIKEIKTINPDLKVAYHSDGDILEIIPDLIEIGLDVLNPVQPACMDPAKVKEMYGKKLSFWGTIDEQDTLPFKSSVDVKNEVLLRMDTVGKGGGLILAPTHHVQLDTPMENFWAMVNTAMSGENFEPTICKQPVKEIKKRKNAKANVLELRS